MGREKDAARAKGFSIAPAPVAVAVAVADVVVVLSLRLQLQRAFIYRPRQRAKRLRRLASRTDCFHVILLLLRCTQPGPGDCGNLCYLTFKPGSIIAGSTHCAAPFAISLRLAEVAK